MIRRKNNYVIENKTVEKIIDMEVKNNDVKSNDVAIVENVDNFELATIQLCLDDINISLKVFAELKSGYKLRVEGGKHLAEDNSYMSSLSRYAYGHNRDQIIDYLENLLIDIELNVDVILSEIRSKINIEKNVCKLDNLIQNISIFLHNYENFRSLYVSDSVAFSKFGNIKYNFETFIHSFFKNITTYSI